MRVLNYGTGLLLEQSMRDFKRRVERYDKQGLRNVVTSTAWLPNIVRVKGGSAPPFSLAGSVQSCRQLSISRDWGFPKF